MSAASTRPSAGRFGPIFDPTRSVVLVASAGTGKTWRLVRRYLRIIAGAGRPTGEPWATPEQVVAVTFTRAAAAEMRARVFAALTCGEDEVEADDPISAEVVAARSIDARLSLAERVAAAPIGTLHSLCTRLLAEFPELSGVPPDARPLEPAEQTLELDAFVRGWLDRAVDEPTHPAHDDCVALLVEHPLGFVRSELRAMVDEPDDPGKPRLRDWREPAAIEAARRRFVTAQWREYLELMAPALALLFQACVQVGQRGQPSGKQLELAGKLSAVMRHMGGDGRSGGASNLDLTTIHDDVQALVKTQPSNELGDLGQLLQQLRNIHQVTATRRERPVLPSPGVALDPAQARHLARWIALAERAREDWAESLRTRALLRYDDLERLARQLLEDPRAQVQLRGRYRHLLVDEYQDINATQALIIERLAELCGAEDAPVQLFFVGDPKQSIYRFRGADPQVFQRAEATVADGQAVVTLDENRRSSPSLARFFAQLFPPLFAGRLPWADTSEWGRPAELARLRDVLDHAPVPWDRDIVAVREQDRLPGMAVDLLLRSRDRPAADPRLQSEAERIAAHVRGLLAGATLGESDDSGGGPRLTARDVAILVPRWNQSEEIRAALEAVGIAADFAGGRGLLLLPEVRDLINLIRLWVDDRDELAAVAVLRGPCFAISDLGLYVLARWPGVDRRLREADPDLPEYAALDEVWERWDDEDDESENSENSENSEAPRWPRAQPRRMREVLRHGRLDPDRAMKALAAAGVLDPAADPSALRAQLQADTDALEANRDRFRALVRHAGARPSADLLADLIAALRLEAAWLASPRGRRAVANAWRFVEHVRVLEPEGPDLQRLAAWLDIGAEPAPEGLISPEADAVTIATWHGAKGKEWPVVVVAGIGDFRSAGERSSWSRDAIPTLDSARGEALPVPRIRRPHQGFAARPDPLHEVCQNMLAPLEAAEAKRLLYVAMTRARERLVLSGEADARAHVHYDDKPWLGLDWRVDMKHLIGEPKPAYLCKRPIELLVAGLDIPAGSGPELRPRAAAWSLAHLRVLDDAMLLAGMARPLLAPAIADAVVTAPVEQAAVEPAVERVIPVEPTASAPQAAPPIETPTSKPGRKRKRARVESGPEQLDLLGLLTAARVAPPESPATPAVIEAPPPHDPLRWRAGAASQLWRPSAGRSPWPVSSLEWDMPLPARRPVILDDEDPRLLGELFHAAMERWDFEGDPPGVNTLDELTRVHFAIRDPAQRRLIARWLGRCLDLVTDADILPELRAARARGELFHEVDVDALIPEADRDHRISGRIDLLWRSPEGWNVLDYKVTTKVRSRAQMEELQWEYGPQLLLYRKALTRWRPAGEVAAPAGRFGLWLATAGKAMWML